MPHIVETKIRCVDHTSEIDIVCQMSRLLQLTVGVEIICQIVRSSVDSGIREDVIDSGVAVLS